jgi:hypothetical protein
MHKAPRTFMSDTSIMHAALITLGLLFALPLILFLTTFLIALADFTYAHIFPSTPPSLAEDPF